METLRNLNDGDMVTFSNKLLAKYKSYEYVKGQSKFSLMTRTAPGETFQYKKSRSDSSDSDVRFVPTSDHGPKGDPRAKYARIAAMNRKAKDRSEESSDHGPKGDVYR
jgi:hypothetical protein